MKKLSLLLGTLGGAMAGYLLSNKKLREQLSEAKDAEEAAKLLGKHLQRDGKKLAKQVKEFVETEEVQAHVRKAKGYAKEKVDEATEELKALAGAGKKCAKKAAKKGTARAKKAVKRTATKAKKKAKKTARRVKMTTKTLS